jgi:hypothetical protein
VLTNGNRARCLDGDNDPYQEGDSDREAKGHDVSCTQEWIIDVLRTSQRSTD